MKLDHIQLAMPEGEEENARAFFSGVLGMTEESKPLPLNERGGCWFRKGSVILHIGVDKIFTPQEKAHPAFVVADLSELAEKLKDHGHLVIWDDALPDRERFYSSDPFGNRIEFIKEGMGFRRNEILPFLLSNREPTENDAGPELAKPSGRGDSKCPRWLDGFAKKEIRPGSRVFRDADYWFGTGGNRPPELL